MGSGYKTFAVNSVLTAADVQGYLQDQAVMSFASSTARGTAISSPVEGMMTYLRDSDKIEVYTGTAWVSVASTNSYRYVQTVYFTSSGTFSKASYPWLRAIRVKVQGAGGGGAGSGSNNRGSGGGGAGGYCEKFITDISGLAADVTVTVGSGGGGGAAGNNNGSAGGNSSFSASYVGNGGSGGTSTSGGGAGGDGGAASGGDLNISGGNGNSSSNVNDASIGAVPGGSGGNTVLGFSGRGGINISTGQAGQTANGYGGGGGGAYRISANYAGGAGTQGIVIVELFA